MKTPNSLAPPRISGFLEQEKLHGIVKKAYFLQQIQQLIAQAHPDLSLHCRVANIKGKELILEVDSAAWLMHARFLNANLLQLIKKHIPEITKIHQQISPPAMAKPPIYWEKKQLSATTRNTLEQIAETISDKNLQNTLLNLAKKDKVDSADGTS